MDETHFSGLLDVQERHRTDPMTFSIPRSEVRRSLEPGSRVKLFFGVGSGDPPPAERMWVEVTQVRGERYVGELANEPVVIADLRLDDEVVFGPEHVAAIWRESLHEPRLDQFAIVSAAVWQGGAVPSRAIRVEPPDTAFSGWIIFAEEDPVHPRDDLAGFEPVNHQALTDRFRSIDSIEDEPAGTAWRWDDIELEWVRDVPPPGMRTG
jgi:hypothetical protein